MTKLEKSKIELDEAELRLLEGMSVGKDGQLFFDTNNGGRAFLFVRSIEEYTSVRDHSEISKVGASYVSGDKTLVVMRKYDYLDCGEEREKSVFRLLGADGIWYTVVFTGSKYVCEVLTNNDTPKNNSKTDDEDEDDEEKEDKKNKLIRLGQDFPTDLIPPRESYKKTEFTYDFPETELKVEMKDENGCFLQGFSLVIAQYDSHNTRIFCDGETISVKDSPEETLPFSYENFVSIVKKHVGTKKVAKTTVPFVCNAAIPAMIEYTMERINYLLTLRKSIDEKQKVECLSQIYEEFEKHIEISDDVRHTLNKHSNEVQKS